MVQVLETSDQFEPTLTENQVVVADFFATWCGPCKAIAPMLDDLEKEYTEQTVKPTPAPAVEAVETTEGETAAAEVSDAPAEVSELAKNKIKFVKIDVDQLSDLAAKMNITVMPTLLVFVDSVLKKTIMGANVPAIKETIAKAVEGTL